MKILFHFSDQLKTGGEGGPLRLEIMEKGCNNENIKCVRCFLMRQNEKGPCLSCKAKGHIWRTNPATTAIDSAPCVWPEEVKILVKTVETILSQFL